VPFVMSTLGIDVEEAQRQMTKESGLLGLSDGAGNDMRDLNTAADEGNADARLAIDHFVHSIRKYIGSFYLELGGLDGLVFTAGIGEKDADLREGVCKDLAHLGIALDLEKNRNLSGEEEEISASGSSAQIWVIPTNEELIVAREARRLLTNS